MTDEVRILRGALEKAKGRLLELNEIARGGGFLFPVRFISEAIGESDKAREAQREIDVPQYLDKK